MFKVDDIVYITKRDSKCYKKKCKIVSDFVYKVNNCYIVELLDAPIRDIVKEYEITKDRSFGSSLWSAMNDEV